MIRSAACNRGAPSRGWGPRAIDYRPNMAGSTKNSSGNTSDVGVIGAGIVGAAIAWELVQRGASVTLLDARGVGLGSTQASAGMLVPYIEGLRRGPMLDLAVASLGLYDEFVERVTRDSGVSVGYQRTGSLEVATEDESAEELKAAASSLTAAGVVCALLNREEAREAEPQLAPDVIVGLFVPGHGFVVANDLPGALTAAAIKHGAKLCVPARVRRISFEDKSMNAGSAKDQTIRIELENETLTARHVVIAAGSWSGQLDLQGIPPLPVRPVRGQLLQLAWSGPPLARVTWGSRCYLVPVSPEAVLVGATVEEAGFDERVTVAGVRDLLDAACDLIPHAWQATFSGARVGLRPGTPDELPIIGRSRKFPGVVYATGHYRNGVLLAPLTAKLVADLIVADREDPMLAPTSPQRFGEY